MQCSAWENGGISINITEAYKEHIEYTFNAFSVRLPAIIIFAPIREISKIHEYMENCMTVEFSASSFSALTNRLRIFRFPFQTAQSHDPHV